MHKPAGYLSRQSKQRIHNAKHYLRKLLRDGKYDHAREYARAQGLTLEPATGGEGVGSAGTLENINRSTAIEQNSTKSLLNDLPVDTCNPQVRANPSSASLLVEGAEGTEEASRSASVKASSAPMLRIGSKGVVHEQLGKLWWAFATRVRQARAHSVMSWPEWEAMEDELGAVGKAAAVRDQVVTETGVVNVSNPELLYGSDPVGTVRGTVWKEVPNKRMRIVQVGSGEEVVCWVAAGKVPAVGQEIYLVPNQDERGGYVAVGEYGKQGGRVR